MKLSWHVQRVLGWQPPLAREVGLQWVKIVNPPAGGTDPFPGVRKAVRFWHDDVQAHYIRDGAEGGRRWFRDFLPRMRECPWADHFETTNEPGTASNEELATLCQFSIAAMEMATRNGIRLCILNLPEGNPASGDPDPARARVAERWKLEQLLPAVRHAANTGHDVGLHCYWLADRGIGPLNRWHALGRVEWNVGQWIAMGVSASRLRVFVNETGVDGLIRVPGEEPRVAGWRTRSNLAEYAQHVAEFDARAQQLPWLVTYNLFTTGFEPPWESYDHSESELRTIHNAVRQPAPPPVAAPSTPITPTMGPAFPLDPWVEQHRRPMTLAEFDAYLRTLPRRALRAVWLHHTATAPTRWTYQTVLNVRDYYRRQPWTDNAGRIQFGWSGGPHLFIGDEGIWLFNPLTRDGVHVRGHNVGTIGVEMIGTFDTVRPSETTWRNTIGALAIIQEVWGVEMLRFHREASDKTCPGTLVNMAGTLAAIAAWRQNLGAPFLPEHTESDVWNALGIVDKAVWWLEQAERERQAGNDARAQEIRLSLIRWLETRRERMRDDT